MKNFNKIAWIFLLVVFISCKKSTDEFVPYENSDFNDIEWSNEGMSSTRFKAITTALKLTTLEQNFEAQLTTTKDLSTTTSIKIPANACLLNNSVYTGMITAKLDEIKTKGDFIRNLLSNCNEHKIQESVAAFNLNLLSSQNQNLAINQNSKIDLSFNDGSFPGVGYNYHFINQNNSWELANSSTMGIMQIANTIINGNQVLSYQINTNTTGFMNISRDLNFGGYGKNTIITPINFTNKNTVVFAVLKNYNTVIQLKPNVVSKTFEGNNLPLNEQVTFVALSYLDGKFYLGYKEEIVKNNIQVNIRTSLTNISIVSLNNYLNSL